MPVLSSSIPWISSSGSLILSAYVNGDIFVYVSDASQYVRSSAWKLNGVSVRL